MTDALREALETRLDDLRQRLVTDIYSSSALITGNILIPDTVIDSIISISPSLATIEDHQKLSLYIPWGKPFVEAYGSRVLNVIKVAVEEFPDDDFTKAQQKKFEQLLRLEDKANRKRFVALAQGCYGAVDALIDTNTAQKLCEPFRKMPNAHVRWNRIFLVSTSEQFL